MEKQLNSFGKAVLQSEQNAKLDAAVKKMLSHRQILAYILKYAVQDFSGFQIEEIMPMIDRVHISSISKEPGMTNDMITGEAKDYQETGENLTMYDIRFTATLPGTGEYDEYNVIIDVEAQAKQNEGYDQETRGIAYCGRMISEQMGRNARNSHYEKLEKVYSIFVCMNCAQKYANTISEYGIQEINRVGNYTGNPKVDLLRLVMIRLPKDDAWDKAGSPPTRLTEMLSTLLSNQLTADDKLETLENKFGIETTEDIRQGVIEMSNYSSAVMAKGYEIGQREGFDAGQREGYDTGQIEGAVRAYGDMGLSDTEIKKKIMSVYKLTEEEAERYIRTVYA